MSDNWKNSLSDVADTVMQILLTLMIKKEGLKTASMARLCGYVFLCAFIEEHRTDINHGYRQKVEAELYGNFSIFFMWFYVISGW